METIYEETVGYIDIESSDPNGVQVQLKYCHDESYDSCSHYILKKRVMVDGELVIDSLEAISPYGERRQKLIRRAIKEFDELVASHPAFGDGKAVTL